MRTVLRTSGPVAFRLSVSFPEGGPQTETAESQQKVVMLRADVSAHARKVQYRELTCARPKCVVDALNGKPVRAPQLPLCALGLPRPELEVLFGNESHADWWGAGFDFGRAPFGSKFCAV